MSTQRRDLFVTTQTPVLRSGRAVRTHSIARALARHRGVDLLYVRFGASEPDASLRAIAGVELCEVIPSRGLRRAFAYALARAERVPPALARAVSAELVDTATRMALAPSRGRVIADGPDAAGALLRLARRRAVVYNAHNLESAFRHQLGHARAGERLRLRKFETRLLERFEESWMVSDADIAGAHELAPHAKLRYVPNAVDVDAIRRTEPDMAACTAIFVASFSYEPNRVALAFLLDDVMPRVWSQLPEAKLKIVGGGLSESPSSDPRVTALGFVDDLNEAYVHCSCAVVPLLQGGGSPLKLVEALAYGLPVVATPRAAAGLRLHDGVDCVIADGADDFATALAKVLREGAPAIARQGRTLAERLYSIEALSELVAPPCNA